MACDHSHTHLVVFAHVCGYYSRAATNQGVTSIRINTVLHDQTISEPGNNPVNYNYYAHSLKHCHYTMPQYVTYQHLQFVSISGLGLNLLVSLFSFSWMNRRSGKHFFSLTSSISSGMLLFTLFQITMILCSDLTLQ